MLKVIYDISHVGGVFKDKVDDFQDVFVGEHFQFNKDYQEQFEQLFNIHATIAHKWVTSDIAIKIYGQPINSTTILGLLGLLLSQGFIYGFHSVYKTILKPFLEGK